MGGDPSGKNSPDLSFLGSQQESGRSRKMSNFSLYLRTKLAAAEEQQSDLDLNFDAESANPLSRRDKGNSFAAPSESDITNLNDYDGDEGEGGTCDQDYDLDEIA